MISNCFECTPWRSRLLAALAGECARLGADIAALGASVTAGQADTVVLQAFDAYTQAARSLGALLNLLGGEADELRAGIARVPLPVLRARLYAAMDGTVVADAGGTSADVLIWREDP